MGLGRKGAVPWVEGVGSEVKWAGPSWKGAELGLTVIFRPVSGPQAPPLHRGAPGRRPGRPSGCPASDRVLSPLGFAGRERRQPPGAREGRVGAGLRGFTGVNGSPQRQEAPAGPGLRGDPRSHHQRSLPTGPENLHAPPPTGSRLHPSPRLCGQVQIYASLHLTRAVLSWLSEDEGQLMKELWKAVAWFRDGELFAAAAGICRLLFPNGASGTGGGSLQ